MRVGELKPGDKILHPTTGQKIKVSEVKHVRRQLRVYFTEYGISGWFMVGSMDQEVNIPRRE